MQAAGGIALRVSRAKNARSRCGAGRARTARRAAADLGGGGQQRIDHQGRTGNDDAAEVAAAVSSRSTVSAVPTDTMHTDSLGYIARAASSASQRSTPELLRASGSRC